MAMYTQDAGMVCMYVPTPISGSTSCLLTLLLIQVWNPSGVLLGKFFVGASTANFAFAGQGKLVILAETNIYLVKGLNVRGQDLEVVKA